MKFLHKVTAMTNITDNMVETPNYITQFSNFLFLFITLDGSSIHNDIPRFQNNNISIIVDVLGVSSATILNKKFKDKSGKMTRRISEFQII